MKTLNETAKARACPYCGAFAGEKCVREDGQTPYGNGRDSYHVSRLYGLRETQGGARR